METVAEMGSIDVAYRRTQAGERKLALLLACDPARPSGEGQTPPALSLIPAPPPEFFASGGVASTCNYSPPGVFGHFVTGALVCVVPGCAGRAVLGVGGYCYCFGHGRQLVLGLENVLACVGEGMELGEADGEGC